MPIYFGVGGAVVSEEEYAEKQQLGIFDRVKESLSVDRLTSLDIGGRNILAADAFTGANAEGNRFTPIEFGKPLAVEIRWVFTGNRPRKTWADSTKDILITSAFKSLSKGEISDLTSLVYEAREHAIDIIRREAKSIGADSVVGIKTHIHEMGSLIEFMAIGTAIKRMPGVKTLTATLPPQAIIRDKETWISNDYAAFGTTE